MRSQRLDPLLKIMQQRQDAVAREVADRDRVLGEQEQRLEALRRYAEEYAAAPAEASISPALLVNRLAFRERLNAAVVQQAGIVDQSRQLSDVERAWDELQIVPKVVERHGRSLLVRGRVYARSRPLGIRDMPVAWIWDLAGGKFTRGEVFRDPEEAVRRLAAAT